MKTRIRNFINLCKICKCQKYDLRSYKIKYAETPAAQLPLYIFHVDIFISGQDRFLSCVDKFSRYAMLMAYFVDLSVVIIRKLITLKLLIGRNQLIDRGRRIRLISLNDFIRMNKIIIVMNYIVYWD